MRKLNDTKNLFDSSFFALLRTTMKLRGEITFSVQPEDYQEIMCSTIVIVLIYVHKDENLNKIYFCH